MSSLGHCRRATRAVARRLNASIVVESTDLPTIHSCRAALPLHRLPLHRCRSEKLITTPVTEKGSVTAELEDVQF